MCCNQAVDGDLWHDLMCLPLLFAAEEIFSRMYVCRGSCIPCACHVAAYAASTMTCTVTSFMKGASSGSNANIFESPMAS